MSEEAIDLKEVLERVQDDRELLLELFDIFLEDCPVKIQAIRDAAAKKDISQLKDVAHSMKGAAGNISAKKMHASFLKIEQLAKTDDLAGINNVFKELDNQLADVRSYASKFRQELKR